MAAPAAPCPFCGGRPIRKRPLLDGAKIAFHTALGGASVEPEQSGETYLKCNGCAREFVPADRDIENILFGLRIEPSVPHLIRRYHGEGVTVTDLLTKHRTDIVRKAHHYRSRVSVSAVKNEIIICFRRRGVRTFGTFAQKSDKSGGANYYIFKGLSKA